MASSRWRASSVAGSAISMQKLSWRAAADPAAQLVQLGQPEQVGALDHHQGGVGHVDPDLDHGGGHQHLQLAGPEALHQRPPLGHRQLPVQAADAVAAQLALAPAGPPRPRRPWPGCAPIR